jgi:hypothetical protein
MADSKISALSAITALAGTDEMVVASSGASKKITGANLGASPTVRALLFSSVLSGAAASIDTGANAIPAGYNILEVFILAAASGSGALVGCNVTINGDSGSHYDRQGFFGNNTSATANQGLAAANWGLVAHGNSGSTSYPASIHLVIPGYAATTFWKAGSATMALPDATAGNNYSLVYGLGWRSTAAINQLTFAAAAGNFLTGTSVYIYGR